MCDLCARFNYDFSSDVTCYARTSVHAYRCALASVKKKIKSSLSEKSTGFFNYHTPRETVEREYRSYRRRYKAHTRFVARNDKQHGAESIGAALCVVCPPIKQVVNK